MVRYVGRSLRSRCIKGSDESLGFISSFDAQNDANDHGSLILLQIISEESLHSFMENETTAQFCYTAKTLPQQNNITKS